MKVIFIIIFITCALFANEQKEYLMNNMKSLIQKEEYISLAINKYILQTGKIPKNSDSTINWEVLEKGYLNKGFSQKNPYTNKDTILITFDDKNNSFIKGIIQDKEKSKEEHKYLYNLYTDSKFRVNTIPPSDTTDKMLLNGTQVLYEKIQKDIVKIINNKKEEVLLSKDACTKSEHKNKYFYELANEKLIYKYCKNDLVSLEVYQNPPIMVEDRDDLLYIKGNIGDTAFVKKGNEWSEYYFHGKAGDDFWSLVGKTPELKNESDTTLFESQIAGYIPNAKDFYIRQGGGCYLANGDIYCWGKNDFKKVGIQNYGQLDKTLTPDYVNTPVMLKSQIDTTLIKDTNWYNSPYRVKFEKMAVDRSNVCGITKIFKDNKENKVGGELYCNGRFLSKNIFQNDDESAILKKYIEIKDTENKRIYWKDIAMVEDVTALLSENGKIYTMGRNYQGALGLGNFRDLFLLNLEPKEIKANSSLKFEKIFGLRDSRTFGAITSEGKFYIWGERNNVILSEPTHIGKNIIFDPNGIFVNTNEFILIDKSNEKKYYKTDPSQSDGIKEITELKNNPISISYYKYNEDNQKLLYIDKSLKLKGSEELLTCKDPTKDNRECNQTSKDIFNKSLNFLNTETNTENDKYANFTNVSIFKLDHIIEERYDNFEWSDPRTELLYDVNNNLIAKIMGRFGNDDNSSGNILINTTKNYNFGTNNNGKEVKINFDFYQICSWDDRDIFYVYKNKVKIYSKNNDNRGTLVNLECSNSSWKSRKYTIEIKTKLDSEGKINLAFGSSLDEPTKNESYGISNLTFKNGNNELTELNNDDWILKKYNNKTFSGTHTSTQAPLTNSTEIVPDLKELKTITQRIDPTTIMGRFLLGVETLEKTYKFGKEKEYANHEVEVEFDFFEIDSWDMERFQVFLNGKKVAEDAFIHDVHPTFKDTNDSGIYTLNLGKSYNLNLLDKNGDNWGRDSKGTKYSMNNDQVYRYKVKGKLDNDGKLHILMRVRDLVANEYGNNGYSYGQGIDDESWGVDSIKVKVKETDKYFVCAMTGVEEGSQMYCWGDVARSLPLLSTSLYNVDRIKTINKLFITQESESNEQMSFDEYNNKGKLFLKYPTYINGFDYPFYFK